MKVEFIEVKPLTGLMIGSSMLVAGLLFIVWKYQRMVEEVDSLRWPVTAGVVESSSFHRSTKSSAKRSSSTTYHGEFAYRYSVNEAEYLGSRYDAKGDMQTGLESQAAMVESKIQKGATVEVFYDPDHPSRSLLKNGISEDTWVRITFSSFLLLVGLFVTAYQWKRLKSQNKL